MEKDQRYNFKITEDKWQKFWDKNGKFLKDVNLEEFIKRQKFNH